MSGRRNITTEEAIKSLSKLFPHLTEQAIFDIINKEEGTILIRPDPKLRFRKFNIIIRKRKCTSAKRY